MRLAFKNWSLQENSENIRFKMFWHINTKQNNITIQEISKNDRLAFLFSIKNQTNYVLRSLNPEWPIYNDYKNWGQNWEDWWLAKNYWLMMDPRCIDITKINVQLKQKGEKHKTGNKLHSNFT